jgi:quinol monooxygenase YgiN
MGLTHVRLTIEWSVPLGQARPITMALHTIAAETRTVRGCVGCSVAADMTDSSVVRYTEIWRTEEDLRLRLQSDTFSQLIMLIENATKAPHIEFTLPNATRGFDFVAEVRAPTG